MFTNNDYWFWSGDHKQGPNARRLNWFGLLEKSSGVQIAVEINTPYSGKNSAIAGFFARNVNTGRVYLMHSGRVGGGKKGVNKSAFLAYSGQRQVAVYDTKGQIQNAILVMPIEGEGAIKSALNYTDSIVDFKQAVRNNETNTPKANEDLKKGKRILTKLVDVNAVKR